MAPCVLICGWNEAVGTHSGPLLPSIYARANLNLTMFQPFK